MNPLGPYIRTTEFDGKKMTIHFIDSPNDDSTRRGEKRKRGDDIESRVSAQQKHAKYSPSDEEKQLLDKERIEQSDEALQTYRTATQEQQVLQLSQQFVDLINQSFTHEQDKKELSLRSINAIYNEGQKEYATTLFDMLELMPEIDENGHLDIKHYPNGIQALILKKIAQPENCPGTVKIGADGMPFKINFDGKFFARLVNQI